MPFTAHVERGPLAVLTRPPSRRLDAAFSQLAARSASTKGVPMIACSIPFERPLLPGVPESGQEDDDEHEHLDEAQQAERLKPNGPGDHEDDLDIEHNEQHRDDVVAHGKLDTRIGKQRASAFIRSQFGSVGTIRPDESTSEQREGAEDQTHDDKQQNRYIILRNARAIHTSSEKRDLADTRSWCCPYRGHAAEQPASAEPKKGLNFKPSSSGRLMPLC